MSAASDRVTLRYRVESVYGTPPGGEYQELRYTGEGILKASDFVESAEIEDDRQPSEVIRVGVKAEGPINFQLSYGTYDEWLRATLASAAWSSVESNSGTTISFAVSSGGTQEITDSGSGFGSFVVNQWTQIYGATNAENNGIYKLSAVAAGAISVYNATGVLESAGASVTCNMGAQIVNGIAKTSITLEKEFQDLSNVFELISGIIPDTWSLETAAKGIINGTFGVLGQDDISATSTDAGSNLPKTTTQNFNAVDHVLAIHENNAVYGVTQVGIEYGNQLRSDDEVGAEYPVDISMGEVSFKGTHRAFFATQTVMDKYRNDTESSLALIFQDDAGSQGNAYVIEAPRIKYTSGQTVSSGKNISILADMAWTASKHAVEGITCRIVRFPTVA